MTSLVRLCRLLSRILNDAVMGLLALVSLFLALAPLVFAPSSFAGAVLEVAELGIITTFAVEYVASFVIAPSRLAYVRNPWRVLDAVVVVTGVLSLLPFVHDLLRNSPVLRLLRLARLALLGARSGGRLRVQGASSGLRPVEIGDLPEVHALTRSEPRRFEPVDWETALDRIRSDEEDWILLHGAGRDRFGPIASSLNVPEAALRRLFDATFPRLERLERFTTLFAWYPVVSVTETSEVERVERAAVLLVSSVNNVVVLTTCRDGFVAALERRLSELDESIPPLVRATHALIKEIVRAYYRVVEGLETSLIRIEAREATLRDHEFLERTFRLRAEISRVRGNLRRLKEVVRQLSEKRIAIRRFDQSHLALFALLADDAEDLYQSVDDLRESLAALVDLRLNVASFQMNRVMRLLALLTALALIPSIAGGLLGMNLSDTPWPATLAQVSFGIGAGMALSLYIFAVKGWLR